MRRAVRLWEKSKTTGDFTKVIRIVERLFLRDDPELTPGVGVNVLLKKDPLSALARLCIRPTSLFEGLWCQFVLAVDGNVNLRTCTECKKWFTVKAGKGRSDKEYCSDACRMRAYRKRKNKRSRKRRH